MAYYKDDGYNYNRRNDRGYNNRGFRGNNYDNYDRVTEGPFKINQNVRHIATGIKLTVIRYGREQVECRKPDLSSEWFYLYELEPIEEE